MRVIYAPYEVRNGHAVRLFPTIEDNFASKKFITGTAHVRDAIKRGIIQNSGKYVVSIVNDDLYPTVEFVEVEVETQLRVKP